MRRADRPAEDPPDPPHRDEPGAVAVTFRAVLFDMDGVVVDTERPVRAFWQELARSEGVVLSAADLDRHVYGRQAQHTLDTLFPSIGADRCAQVYAKLRESEELARYCEVSGAVELLHRLAGSGVPLALVTGAQRWKVAAVLHQLQLDDVFAAVVGAEDVFPGKPDPGCYLLAARSLGVDIEQCVVFEDAVSGVRAAVAAGAACVAVAAPGREEAAYAAGALSTVPDLTGVTFSLPERVLCVGATTVFPFPPRRTRHEEVAG